MSNFDAEGISKKLAGMAKRLNFLAAYRDLTLEEYEQDEIRQATIERFLELIIQGAIDINKILLKQVKGISLKRDSEALTNAEIFKLAGENGFMSRELAEQLAESGKFRNVLAHLYDDLLPSKVYGALQQALIQYPQYITEIQTYLDSMEIEDVEES
ncbi:DUF86 domain-containing protein [Aerosakkonemataceae cyanobacterium BLCC-F154]|uniref:DUF86 domain-containing protein n=1 Tax=Floridaenema fluviatile BLCC-F154 TaxID=3153640 RepID=A0ABV4YKH0_9CYAN